MAMDLQKKNQNFATLERSDVQQFFHQSQIFITGGTGFIGQVLIEKLLRTCYTLDRIYLLIRTKKGKTEEDRFQSLFHGPLFDRLKKEQPQNLKKVTLMSGDCSLPGLGLSEEDRSTIVQHVNVIYHSAATVRFDAKLSMAFAINIQGTKEMLDLAHEMVNLKAFVHISTAYSNCPIKEIHEKFYSSKLKMEELAKVIHSMDEESLDILTPIIIDEWPNTYAFTKCIAEDTIRDHGKHLPIAIIRPSIVLVTAKEPIASWGNNLYSAAGVVAGAGLGLLRSLYCDKDVLADIVPADMTINSSIVIAWDTAKNFSEKNKGNKENMEIPIYNYVSSTQQPVTWGQFMKYNETAISYPAKQCIWYYWFTLNKYKIINTIYTTLLHLLPGLLVDTWCRLVGKKPQLWDAYRKIHRFTDVIAYFSTQQWTFQNYNIQNLWKNLNPQDKQLFDFDISTLDWGEYLFNMIKGLRYYIINEGFSFEDMDIARHTYFRLKCLHYGVVYTIKFIMLVIAFIIFHNIFHNVISK